MRAAGTDEWIAAEPNRPLTSGDALWTESGGRAELHTGNAAVRLDSGTSVSLLEVGTSAFQIKITAGAVSVRLRELEENEEFELDTPDAAVVLLRAGTDRVDVAASGPGTTIAARSGMAEVTAPGTSFVLRQQQEARLPGPDSAQRYIVTSIPSEDGFGAYCAARDRREDRALESKRVPPRLIGYEDLEDHGEWHTDVTYGVVWAPRSVRLLGLPNPHRDPRCGGHSPDRHLAASVSEPACRGSLDGGARGGVQGRAVGASGSGAAVAS